MSELSRPNIVFLTIDALRADHVSCYGYERETTPILDGFAEDGVRFSHAFSPSSHTREAIPAMLTGRYPDTCIDASYSLNATSIAEWLSDTGYATGAFHSNPYISRAFGFDTGFDTFDDDLHLSNHKFIALAQRALDKLRNRHYADAETITNRARSFLNSTTTPFFLWVHYMDPHGPYCPPDAYQALYHGESVDQKRASRLYKRAAVSDPASITEVERQEMLDLYDGEIRYTDDQIGVLLNELRELNAYNESLILISSDHGDAFGEHAYFGHPRRLDQELLHIPLLLQAPDIEARKIRTPVSTLDIVPTIMDSVHSGDTGDGSELPGKSLFTQAEEPEQNRVVYSQVRSEDGSRRRFSARSVDGARFIEWTVGVESDEDEIVNEWGDGPDDLHRQLRQHSQHRIANVSGDGDRLVEPEESARIDQRLEALGYKE